MRASSENREFNDCSVRDFILIAIIFQDGEKSRGHVQRTQRKLSIT